MTSLPILQPGARITDANGNPLSGAKLKFYSAGTTTPLSVYSDADGLTTLGSTVYTDDGGYPVISSGSSTKTLVYSTAEELKVVITDADDTTVATHDNVTSSIPTPSATTTALPTVPVVSKSSDYTVVSGDRGKLINVNPTGGTVEIALPSAVTVGDNWTIGVRHSGPTTTNKVVVRSSGTQTIAGPGQSTQAAIVLHGLGNTVWLVSDGAGWNISSEVPAYMTGQAAYTPVASRRTATPVNPDIGSRYIISGTPTGTWLTLSYAEDDLVEYIGNATWIKYPLRDGLLARVVDEQVTYVYNATAGTWQAWSNVLDPGFSTRKTSRFSNVVADGSGGGTATAGSWATIPITSEYTREVGYESTGASLATSQITIPQGAYRVLITNPFFGTYISRMRFRPVTQTSSWDNTRYSDVVVAGTTDTGPDTVLTTATAVINDEIIIDATSEVFVLEYFVSNTQASVGLGTPSSGTGQLETYARIFLESLDSIQGPQGEQGIQGDDGLDAAYSYAWSTLTTGDPGTGKIRGNNATIASITQIAASETDASGANIAGMLATWDDSTTSNNRAIVKISKEGATGNFAGFKINGAGTDAGTYWTFPVTYISTAGTLANNDTVAVAVSITGDEGAAGITVPSVTGLTNLSPPDYTGTPDKILVHDVSVGGLKQTPITDFGIYASGGNHVFYGTNTSALGINAVGYAGIGIAGFGSTTFVAAPNGSNARFAVSDTSAQLHYDNIVLGLTASSTVTITNASPAVITWTAHGLTAGTMVAFTTTGALPTGLTAGTTYYVIAAGLATDTFRVSATAGGAAINTSSAGSGTHTATALKQTPAFTYKVPDWNSRNGGFDHPLMNIGVSEAAGTYPNSFIFEGGYAGGQYGYCTITNASPAVVTWTAHGLTSGTAIIFSTTGSLPTGITAGTTYYVIATGLTTNTFQFSATPGGAAINTSSAGSGIHTVRYVAGSSGSGIAFLILTPDTAGTQVPRLHITSKDDNTAVAIGTTGASSSAQGSFLNIHARATGTASHVHFTSLDVGQSGTDGASVGLWTANQLRVWHYETNDIVFGVADAQVGKFGSNGNFGLGSASFSPSYALSLWSDSAKVIGIERKSSDAVGVGLSVLAGGAYATGSNRAGGNLTLSSGTSTGTGTSLISFLAPTAGGSGTADNAPGTVATLNSTGLSVGNVAPSTRLHIRSVGSGTGTTTLRVDYDNGSADPIHTSQFTTNDTGSTWRTLFYAAGDSSGGYGVAGTNNQGLFSIFNENGTLRIMEVDSLAAQSAARFRLYDRSNVAQITLHGAGSSTFAGGALLNTHATAGLGYGTGAGGTVTQITSKATGVTLNKACGTITMNNAALAAATSVTFTLTNSAIVATDVVIVNIKSGATANSYQVTVGAVAAGTCDITIRNISGGSLGEAVVLSFSVIKAVAA